MAINPSDIYGSLDKAQGDAIKEAESLYWTPGGQNPPTLEQVSDMSHAHEYSWQEPVVEFLGVTVEEGDTDRTWAHCWRLKFRKPTDAGQPNAGRVWTERFYTNPPGADKSLDQMTNISFANMNKIITAMKLTPVRNKAGVTDHWATLNQARGARCSTWVKRGVQKRRDTGALTEFQEFFNYAPLT